MTTLKKNKWKIAFFALLVLFVAITIRDIEVKRLYDAANANLIQANAELATKTSQLNNISGKYNALTSTNATKRRECIAAWLSDVYTLSNLSSEINACEAAFPIN